MQKADRVKTEDYMCEMKSYEKLPKYLYLVSIKIQVLCRWYHVFDLGKKLRDLGGS